MTKVCGLLILILSVVFVSGGCGESKEDVDREALVIEWLSDHPIEEFLRSGSKTNRHYPAMWIEQGRQINGVSDVLASLLSKRDSRVSSVQLAYALGWMGDPDSKQALMNGLKQKDWLLREQSAIALGRVGGNEAIDALGKVLRHDDNERVRIAAAYSLGEIDGFNAQASLQQGMVDQSIAVFEAARTAALKLQMIEYPTLRNLTPDEQVVQWLSRYDTYWNLPPSLAVDVDCWLIDGRKIPEIKTVLREMLEQVQALSPPLQQELSSGDHPVTTSQIAFALKYFGDESSVFALIRESRNKEDIFARMHAIDALASIADTRAIAPLCDFVRDKSEDVNVKLHAINALSILGGVEAEICLKAASKDGGNLVKEHADMVLKQMEKKDSHAGRD